MKLFFLLSVALTLAAASSTTAVVVADTTTAVVVADTTTAVVVADTTTASAEDTSTTDEGVADTTAMAPDLVCNATTFAEEQVGCFRVYSAVTDNATLDTCSQASFNTSTMTATYFKAGEATTGILAGVNVTSLNVTVDSSTELTMSCTRTTNMMDIYVSGSPVGSIFNHDGGFTLGSCAELSVDGDALARIPLARIQIEGVCADSPEDGSTTVDPRTSTCGETFTAALCGTDLNTAGGGAMPDDTPCTPSNGVCGDYAECCGNVDGGGASDAFTNSAFPALLLGLAMALCA